MLSMKERILYMPAPSVFLKRFGFWGWASSLFKRSVWLFRRRGYERHCAAGYGMGGKSLFRGAAGAQRHSVMESGSPKI